MNKSLLITILLSSLLVGTLDITGACISSNIQYGSTPADVLKYVAGGAYGPAAKTGGTGMILMGLLFHFIIATSFTVLFFLLYPEMKWMQWNKIITGVLYAVFMWLVTTQLIIPMTPIKYQSLALKQVSISIGILTIAIGIPLAFLADNYYRKHPQA